MSYGTKGLENDCRCFTCVGLFTEDEKPFYNKLLLFFSCKDGSDRLMRGISCSCRIFLCVVLAMHYLLNLLPISLVVLAILVVPFLFIMAHTHRHIIIIMYTRTHTCIYTNTHTRTYTVNPEHFVCIKFSYVGDLQHFVRMKFSFSR